MKYETIDHAADVMVRCFGDDLEECFANAAYAMFDRIVDAETVEGTTERSFSVSGEDEEERLYSFLSELLFISDYEGLVFNDFTVALDGDDVICTARGEPLDPKKHFPRSEIKAVTYHMLSVDRDAPSVTVIFDV